MEVRRLEPQPTFIEKAAMGILPHCEVWEATTVCPHGSKSTPIGLSTFKANGDLATPEEIADRVATGTAALIADWPKQASCQCGYAHWMRHGPTLDLPAWLAKPPVSEIAGHGPLSPYSLN